MSKFKRIITKEEFNELKIYLQYFSENRSTNINSFETLVEMGVVFRTPVIRSIAENYKEKNPGIKLPSCLRQ